MSQVALGNPENYTIGGMRFYFAENLSGEASAAITAVTASSFTIAGDLTANFGVGAKIRVSDSTGNDGDYYVTGSALSVGETVISVEETVPDLTVDGDITRIRLPELYLGNVVTGAFSSDITFLDHYTAKSGTRSKDRSIVQELAVNINLTMDEPNVDAMNLFMLGGTIDAATGTPEYRRFAPFTKTERNGGARLGGVSDTGNEFIWTIRRSTLKPDGEFSYNDQDWSQFSFILEVLDNSSEDNVYPFGFMDHYGVDEDIEAQGSLLPNN